MSRPLLVHRGEIDFGALDVERLQLRAFRHAEWEGAGIFGNRSWIDEVRRREVRVVGRTERRRPLALQRLGREARSYFERDRNQLELLARLRDGIDRVGAGWAVLERRARGALDLRHLD